MSDVIPDYTGPGWPSPSTLYKWARNADEDSWRHLARGDADKEADAKESAKEYRRQARVKTAKDNDRFIKDLKERKS